MTDNITQTLRLYSTDKLEAGMEIILGTECNPDIILEVVSVLDGEHIEVIQSKQPLTALDTC